MTDSTEHGRGSPCGVANGWLDARACGASGSAFETTARTDDELRTLSDWLSREVSGRFAR